MSSVADVINIIFRGLQLALFVRIILSWIPHDPFHPFIQLLSRITDPILLPCRQLLDRFLPGGGGLGIDFSPILAFFLLNLTNTIVIRLLLMVGSHY